MSQTTIELNDIYLNIVMRYSLKTRKNRFQTRWAPLTSSKTLDRLFDFPEIYLPHIERTTPETLQVIMRIK